MVIKRAWALSFLHLLFFFFFACCFSHVFFLLFWLLLLGVGFVDSCCCLLLGVSATSCGCYSFAYVVVSWGAILLHWCYCCFTLVLLFQFLLCLRIDVIVFYWCCHFMCWCYHFALVLHFHIGATSLHWCCIFMLVLLFCALVLFSSTFWPKHCCCCFRIGDVFVYLISLVFLSLLSMCKLQHGPPNYQQTLRWIVLIFFSFFQFFFYVLFILIMFIFSNFKILLSSFVGFSYTFHYKPLHLFLVVND